MLTLLIVAWLLLCIPPVFIFFGKEERKELDVLGWLYIVLFCLLFGPMITIFSGIIWLDDRRIFNKIWRRINEVFIRK